MRDNTKTVGDLAELKVACLFAEKGCFVSRPMTDNAPYDLIIDDGNGLKKVQVKARTEKDGRVVAELRTTMINYNRLYEKSDFDLLAVYNINTDKIAILSWDDLGEGQAVVLRTTPTKNKQNKGVKFFDDYIPR